MTARFAALEAEVSAWLVAQGLGGAGIPALLGGFSDRLLAGGIALSRTFLAMPTISPEFRAVNVTWRRDTGVAIREDVDHDRFPAAFLLSPIAMLIDRDIRRRRWRLGHEGGTEGFSLLEELRVGGDTDYIAEIVPFGAASAFAVPGVALTACSDAPDGFADEEVRLMSALTQPLALATYRLALFDLTVDLLGAYLGQDAGRRVLNGEIRRGAGQSVEGVLMMADLAGFTAVSDTADGTALVVRLGEHLAAMVEPIERMGGGVLKFMGDGILAGFAIDADPDRGGCAPALAAALAALARNEAVNLARPGETPLPLKIGLHRGRVFYGNVGAGSRLDFTVIGPAVNEASRLQALCGILGRPLLMSEGFARDCGQAIESLGPHRLRGVAEPREIFAVPGV